MFDLTNKRALIVGGTGDLGKSIAKALGQAGAELILAGIDSKEKVRITQEEFQTEGLQTRYEEMDVASLKSIKKVINNYDYLDILINCAGVNVRKPMIEITEEEWNKVIDVNLKGTFQTSQLFAEKAFQNNNHGKIINLGSLSSHIALPNMSPYVASKGGISQLTKAMAIEWAPNIQVNTIAPGYFHTDLTAPLFEDKEWTKKILSRIPTGRTGNPDDLNGAAVFLASGASNYITGQTIYIDGGWTVS